MPKQVKRGSPLNLDSHDCPYEQVGETAAVYESQEKGSDFEFARSSSYKDNALSASGWLDFPISVAKVIGEKMVQLEECISDLKLEGKYHFEAGYDIFPENCTFIFPEQACCFQGFREMLWIVIVLGPKNSPQYVRQRQLIFLRDVADHIYSPVAILDSQAQVVLAYDIEIISDDRSTSLVHFLAKDVNGELEAKPALTNCATHQQTTSMPGSTSFQGGSRSPIASHSDSIEAAFRSSRESDGPVIAQEQRLVSNSHDADHFEGLSDRQSQVQYFTDGEFTPPSLSVSEQLIPFRCSADISGLDGSSQELSITLLPKIETSSPDNQYNRDARLFCRVTAEHFEGRVTSLDRMNQTALRLQELYLTMGPSMEGFNGTEIELKRYQRSTDALSQKPTRIDIALKDASLQSENGIGVKLAYPFGVTIEGNKKRISGITRSAESANFDHRVLSIDCVNRNHFLWRYGFALSTPFLSEPLFIRSAPFTNHIGEFSYASDKLPRSMKLQITVVYKLPSPSLSSRLWTPTFVRDRRTNYPCRHIRLTLQVDISPTENGSFLFPRQGVSGKRLDLGSYKFVRRNDALCLEISRDEMNLSIANLHLGASPKSWEDGRWSAAAVAPGELEIREGCSERTICPTVGQLHLTLGSGTGVPNLPLL